MIWFKRALEEIRLRGVFDTEQSIRSFGDKSNPALKNSTLDDFHAAEVFVLLNMEGVVSGILSSDDSRILECVDGQYKLALPFSTTWFETASGCLIEMPSADGTMKCMGALAKELSPGKIEVTALLVAPNGTPRAYRIIGFYKSISEILEYVNRGVTGVSLTRERVKTGNKAEKRTKEIRRIVYVKPSKRYEYDAKLFSRPIDWTHRFSVRGHWRVLDGGLGKDRDGSYCVQGHTWVSEHIRGPEHVPFIKKTRVVMEDQHERSDQAS